MVKIYRKESKPVMEKFFDYVSNKEEKFYIYVNPTRTEINKFIPSEARGFIDKDGNLYVEGYEDLDAEDSSRIVHQYLLIALVDKIGLPKDYPYRFWTNYIGREEKYGVTVQLHYFGDSQMFIIGESLNKDYVNLRSVQKLFKMAKKKNPVYDFYQYGKEV